MVIPLALPTFFQHKHNIGGGGVRGRWARTVRVVRGGRDTGGMPRTHKGKRGEERRRRMLRICCRFGVISACVA